MPIASDTAVGTVELTVRDLARSQAFYERALGLRATEVGGAGGAREADGAAVASGPREGGQGGDAGQGGEGQLALGVDGEPPLLVLTADPSAPSPPRRSTGLFHFAVLMPTRRDLAVALRRLLEARIPLDGASDHFVSEALYLHDPDDNGIEIYRDRPREDWPHIDGRLEMATLPLDLEDLFTALPPTSAKDALAPPGTRMGHVHLKVSDLDQAEDFYAGVLGFDVTVKGYLGALFVSAGGYHHHLGLNTWQSLGGSPPAAGSVGLRSFDVVLPDPGELDRILGRVDAAGLAPERTNGTATVRDPSGHVVRLTVR